MTTIRSTTGAILYESQAGTIKSAIEEAVQKGVSLRYADLRNADLRYVDLRNADLRNADLRYVDLRNADLSYADLGNADLRYVDLRYADLRYVDLRYVDLSYADLGNADLRFSTGLSRIAEAQLTITPEGSFIGWKKSAEGYLIRLKVPASAKRSNATGRKCRVSKAKVLAIFDGDKPVEVAHSSHASDFVYRVGETVRPVEPFDDDRWNECASGIHLYITRAEAEAH